MVPSLESVKAYCEVSVVEERLLRSPEAPIVLLRRATGPPIGLAADPGSIRELIRPKDGATKSDNDAGEFIAGCNCMHTSWERRLPAGTSAIPRNSLCRQDAGAPRGALALSGDQFPAGSVAPGNPYLGIMLPYAPLHHLLMADLNFPIVATSGNRAEEPICTKEKEALAVLGDLADLFLIHNRPIARPVDDSLARVMMGRELVLRRARGYAPLPIPIKPTAAVALAVGAHLKNTVAVSRGQEIVASQHIGDMATPRAWEVFQEAIHSFTSLYNLNYASVMCDAHPDYRTALFAKQSGQPVQKVQHHFAHVLSGMADNGLEDSVLGVAWDGAGYGLDGTLWGCEFLYVTNNAFHRVAHLRPFRLPGGEKAIHEPRRSALGLLYEIMGEGLFEKSDHLRRSDLYPPLRSFSPSERQALHVVLRRAINAPLTTSAGRLFDAVASLVNLRQVATFEGQAAMELEFACDGMTVNESYEFEMSQAGAVDGSSPLVINWAPTVLSIVKDCRADESIGKISARFHNTLVEIIVAVARRIRQARVLLTGGCFQNKYLTERAIARLRAEGFLPFWHQRVPPNDGGIAVGQALAAARQSLAE
ncbi:MAG: carbamoyltransferase HypF [Acidobacteria bacterium]|nr:carbamoyltransferase HypF [Acidobacteriota bacterium]MBI3655204.1 carbamoyltransferase HypF [Acidobacteriota bacterium]